VILVRRPDADAVAMRSYDLGDEICPCRDSIHPREVGSERRVAARFDGDRVHAGRVEVPELSAAGLGGGPGVGGGLFEKLRTRSELRSASSLKGFHDENAAGMVVRFIQPPDEYL
jgi:hypothetical protein